MNYEKAIIIRNHTRLEQLILRFNTKSQARFYLERSGGNFSEYETEHQRFYNSLDTLIEETSKLIPHKIIQREYVPSYLFSTKDIILVIGQDGLVANVAKYAGCQPIIAVNPDKENYAGILLPFDKNTVSMAIKQVLDGTMKFNKVSMALAKMNDGQELKAFNDLFIGPSTHTSANYRINYKNLSERQSSSGIIVSTGVGSSGWASSLFNMANGILSGLQPEYTPVQGITLDWNSNELLFMVREAFKSLNTSVSLTLGKVSDNAQLEIESLMPEGGKIFSDGIESDYLPFNSGARVKLEIAKEKAYLARNSRQDDS